MLTREASMNRASRRQHQITLRKLKLIPCDYKMTAAAGLGTILEVFDQSPLAKEFAKCLPGRVSHRSSGSYLLGLMVVASHLHGMDCLSDIAKLRKDPYLEKLFGTEVAASRTIGDFLRDFEEEHIERLNRFLNKMSRSIMTHFQELLPAPFQPRYRIVDIDSTYHQQYGDQIEGVNWNYKREWSLETQIAFNQMGLCHGVQLRSGNTKSGTDVEPLLEQCFKDNRTQRLRLLQAEDFFRADSAYCFQGCIRKLLGLGAYFTITANDGTTKWKSKIDKEPLVWEPWVWGEKDVERASKKGVELPQVEVARYMWKPSWGQGKVVLPVVVKRTWKIFSELSKTGQGDLFHQEAIKNKGEWCYYAIVTNFNLSQWSLQEICEHHGKRGNAENFVKEEKYNFKMKSFPCQKMMANHAWLLLSQVAHNLMRWMSVMESPDKPHYAKKLRELFIFSPGRIVSHARQMVLKVSHDFYQEVQRMRERWGLDSATIPPQLSSA
jgi:hypothetical protein